MNNLFITTARGVMLTSGSIIKMLVENSQNVPSDDAAIRPAGAASCIVVDVLGGINTEWHSAKVLARRARYVLGWFATEADAERALEAYQALAVNPFGFASESAFSYGEIAE